MPSAVRLEQPVQVDDDIFHLGIVDRALGLAAPGVLGLGIAVVEADEVDRARDVEVEAARVLDPSAEDQVKLAHARLASGFARTRVSPCRGRVERRIGRGLGGVGRRPSEQAADRLLALVAGEAELVEPLAAGVLAPPRRRRGRCPCTRRAVGRTSARLGLGARQQAAISAPAASPPASAISGASLERVAAGGRLDAVARAVIGLDRALARRSRAGLVVGVVAVVLVGHCAVSVFVLFRLCALRRFLASCASRDAVDELAGEVHQRLAGEEHGDRGDDAGRRERARLRPRRPHPRRGRRLCPWRLPTRRWARRLRARAAPEAPAPSPMQPRARALDLEPRRGDLRAVASQLASSSSRSAEPAEQPPAMPAKISSADEAAPPSGPIERAERDDDADRKRGDRRQREHERDAPNRIAGTDVAPCPWPRRSPWRARARPRHRPCPRRSAAGRARRSGVRRRPAVRIGRLEHQSSSSSSSSLASPLLSSRASDEADDRRAGKRDARAVADEVARVLDQLVGILLGDGCWRHSRSRRRRGGHNRHIPRRAAHRCPSAVSPTIFETLASASAERSRPWLTRPRALSPAWPASCSRPLRRRSASRARRARRRVRSLGSRSRRSASVVVIARRSRSSPLFAGSRAFDHRVGAFGQVGSSCGQPCVSPPLPTSTRSRGASFRRAEAESCTPGRARL